MRAIEFIIEGYPEARQEFTTATGDQNLAIKTIDQFRDLVNRNQVQGNERNIDWWRKQGWNLFYPFVTQKSQEATKTQIKRKKVPGRSINLLETEEWLVVIPLDKEASCFHGRQSDWCTTKPQQSYFEKYFYDKEITLIYCLNKKTTDMWAIAAHIKKPDQPEIFDQRDRSITSREFNQQTGLNSQDLIKMALGEQYQEPIGQAREGYRSSITRTKQLLTKYRSSTTRVPEIEKELLFNKNNLLASKYLVLLINNKISTDSVPEAILLTAMIDDSDLIQYLNNPSERVQIAAVQNDGESIGYIENPSEAVQLAAVKQNGASIKYIKNPLEAVQLAAVQNDGYSIRFIENPSEAVQLAAVQQNKFSIQYIENPTEAVQLAAVQRNGYSIQFINNPSQAVQLAAINQNGYSIQFINNPSQAVQLAAVQNNGYSIRFIENPLEELQLAAVKQNGDSIWWIENPPEAVQLAAVKQNGTSIRFIKNPSPAVREYVRAKK